MEIAPKGAQLRIIQARQAEVLAAGAGGGKSFALRASAILTCSVYPGTVVALIHPRHDELIRDHVEPRAGLKALLGQSPGAVQFRTGEVRFTNGSVLHWAGADRQSDLTRLTEANPKFVLFDDLHRIPRELFEQILLRVQLLSGRVVCASPPLKEAGWVADRWSVVNGRRIVIETSEADLPEDLREQAALPTLEQHMDGLGIPFVGADSPFRRKPYVRLVVDCLQRWFYGEHPRLLVLMATQLGKTLLGVRVMGSYVVRCRPYETIGLVSYSTTVATDRNRDIRDYYVRSGGQLATGAATMAYWKTPYAGGCWATGFGGGAGNPMSWGIIDDPDRDPEESRSEASIRHKDNWYSETWLGRESKHASKDFLSLLTVATRFWSSDTVARMLRLHAERGEAWHILALPALYDPAVALYYEGFAPGLFTVEPDFRSVPNEPIDPEQRDREFWERTQRSNPRVFAGRDQQKPLDAGGGSMFAESWAVDIPVDPAFVGGKTERGVYFRPARAWDFAGTEGGGNYTASAKIGEMVGSQRIVVRHAARAQLGPRDVLRFVAAMMILDGPDVDVVIPEDPAAGGIQQTDRVIQFLKQVSARLTIRCEDCPGETCTRCDHSGWLRLRRPRIRTVSVSNMEDSFADFAARATPVSQFVEGQLDYVRAEWRPTIVGTVPWFWKAVGQADADWQEDLREMEKLSRRLIDENARWWPEYLRELHLFPDTGVDDWVACTSYGWQYLNRPKSIYPGAEERT